MKILKIFLVAFFILIQLNDSFSQVVDRDLILQKVNKNSNEEGPLLEYGFRSTHKFKGPGNFLLSVYQQFFGVLISADCLYQPTCSRYCRAGITKHGLIKGVLLTGDRLTRCSPRAARDVPDFMFNCDGYVEEYP